MTRVETGITPEALSPQAAFDGALKSFHELDPSIISISNVEGASPIHDILSDLVNDPSLGSFRKDEKVLQILQSPDNSVKVYSSRAEDGSRISGIKIERVDEENSAILSEKVNLINEVNGKSKFMPRNDAYFFVQKEFPGLTKIDSVIKGEEVESPASPNARFDDRPITDPEILIEYFWQGLRHAKEKFAE